MLEAEFGVCFQGPLLNFFLHSVGREIPFHSSTFVFRLGSEALQTNLTFRAKQKRFFLTPLIVPRIASVPGIASVTGIARVPHSLALAHPTAPDRRYLSCATFIFPFP